MKVIALLSGGKDSIYNLHHCVLNDHEPVCVASLGPPQGQDELDSFMYQTVAHSGLETLAQALELPFYSTSITGKALNQSAEYGSRSNSHEREGHQQGHDETEDLYRLLKRVKTEMPQVEAVAAGAILSNYQRVRVEHVCARLGLASIAYLWQRDQRDLLNEMVMSGQQSVLVKVAGAGLGVQHLGKTLAEMQPILHKLNERYETHICGEGGEYETFTLDSPIFKKRLILEETQTIVSNPDPHSTVAHLYLSRLSLADKPGHPAAETFEELRQRLRNCVLVSDVLDDESELVREKVQELWDDDRESLPDTLDELRIEEYTTEAGVKEEDQEEDQRPSASVLDGWLHFAAIAGAGSDQSIEEELRACFSKLSALLSSNSASLLSLSHLNLLLSADSMSLFPQINKVYATYFGTSPPTRACVSVRFPPGDRARIKLEGVARVHREEASSRTALHVQSISYWGAANIGPYSQAITVGNRCYIAGQIPLLPQSLALPAPADFAFEVALSLQHVKRIVEAACEGRWSGWNEGGIAWIAEEPSAATWSLRAKAARVGWRAWQEVADENLPPLLFVSAAQLPRAASIEWQVTWQTGQIPWRDDEGDTSSDDGATTAGCADRQRKAQKVETWAREIIHSSAPGKRVSWQCSSVNSVAESVVAIMGCSISETECPPSRNKLGAFHSIKAFHRPELRVAQVEELARRLFHSTSPSVGCPTITCIGAKNIETLEGCGAHDVAFVVVAKVLEV
ncbi:hypothetical protein JCM16303_002174 [Sporobolomyces ruberrimus]